MTKTNTKAFTLIELLIVIVIIGILAVALIPRLTGAQATARDTSRKAALQQGVTVLASYLSQENPAAGLGTMPSSFTGLASTVSSYGTLPTDPQGLSYTVVGSTTGYVACATLEKGNGNFAGACSTVTGGSVAGPVAKSNNSYIVNIQY